MRVLWFYTTSIIYKLIFSCYYDDVREREADLKSPGKEEKTMFTIVLSYLHNESKLSALYLDKEQSFRIVRSYGIRKDDCLKDGWICSSI